MFLDNSVTYGEAKTGTPATCFGGEEGVKDAVNVFAGYASARIRDFNFNAAVMRRSANFEQSPAGHSVAGVQEKIQEDLLQFVG